MDPQVTGSTPVGHPNSPRDRRSCSVMNSHPLSGNRSKSLHRIAPLSGAGHPVLDFRPPRTTLASANRRSSGPTTPLGVEGVARRYAAAEANGQLATALLVDGDPMGADRADPARELTVCWVVKECRRSTSEDRRVLTVAPGLAPAGAVPREPTVARIDEARLAAAVVAGAVVGHGAVVDHGRNGQLGAAACQRPKVMTRTRS